MSANDFLRALAAVAAAGSGAGVAYAASAAWSSLSRACRALRGAASGVARRPTPVVLLASVNASRIPRGLLSVLDGWISKAGNPLDLRAPELAALVEILFVASSVGAAALVLAGALGPLAALASVVVSACAPLLWLRDRMRLRRRELVRALPYAVDLLTLSVEAGLDFTAALAKVAERSRRGALRDELSVALKELKLGRTREEALRSLARRTALPALGSFVQALLHADQMGTPLGKVLRVLSTQMRVERTQRAEKLAHEAPVKLLLPLILCIFPTLFLMLFGPIAFQVLLGGSF